MIKRVLLLNPTASQYDVTRHFIDSLARSFAARGVETSSFAFQQDNAPELLNLVKEFDPQLLISINGIRSQANKSPFADQLGIPHLAILVDGPTHHTHVLQGDYSIVSSPDLFGTFVLRILGAQREFFLPHAVDRSMGGDPYGERPYDIAFYGSCFDYESIIKEWPKKYPVKIVQALGRCVERALEDPYAAHAYSLLEEWDTIKIDPRRYFFYDLANEIDLCLRGKARVALLRSLEGMDVHLFGSDHSAQQGWKYYLGDCKHITFHEPKPFDKVVAHMQQTKIVLNSSPFFKGGLHERMLYGMAAGAAVVTDDTQCVRKMFVPGEELYVYSPKESKGIRGAVSTLLNRENKRQEVAQKGQAKVLAEHTWDQRVDHILEELPRFFDHIKKTCALRGEWSKV